MPELPEVEIITRGLSQILPGRTVESLDFFRKDLREKIPILALKKIFLQQKIKSVFRRAKYILIETQAGFGIFHLGMTGQLIHKAHKAPPYPHTHVRFGLRAQKSLYFLHYVDPRRFGLLSCWQGKDWNEHPKLKTLGVEPLKQLRFGEFLWKQSQGRSQVIKSFIMNAQVLVGVGNIYACEALFRAQIHPELSCAEVSSRQYQKLARSIVSVLSGAIKNGGTSIKDFRNALGKKGFFQVQLKVYGREGESCQKCPAKIIRISQGGRGSWFCPECQKK